MGMFMCAICDNYADSHDGCEELKPNHPRDYRLICNDCAVEREFKREEQAERSMDPKSSTT